jgi:hypothetical protein
MMQAMKGFGTQPSHTFIEGAHLFSRTRARTLGDEALSALERWAPDASSLADAIGLPRNACEPLYDDVLRRLKHQPIQDFRIDFEDGYGFRPDSDEDGHAKWCAAEMAHAVREGIMPPFAGIRTRPFSAAFRARSERTIELFLTTLVQEASGLPVRFVVNLAKVTHTDEVTAVCDVLSSLEESLGLEPGVIALEFMIETPLALSDDEGRNPLRSFLRAGGRRLRGACFGPYDFTTAMGIAPHHQRLQHPACDAARQSILLALSGTGLWLADGSTSLLPVAPTSGSNPQRDTAHVRSAWRAHFSDTLNSLAQGFYQGWDVHGAQLVTRWAAVFTFYRDGFATAGPRLRALVDQRSESAKPGAVFDDPATGESLLRFVRRAVASGAIGMAELENAGLHSIDLDPRMTFQEIVSGATASA